MAFEKITPEQRELLAKAGSNDIDIALPAQQFLAKALELPLRQGIAAGDILDGIFEAQDFTNAEPIEYPLDLYAPGSEKDHVAYAIPNQGLIPQRYVEGDYVQVPTYDIGSSIDTLLKYIKFARWDVVGRMGEVLEAGFVKKMNDDGWHTILAAGVDRNILVYDADAIGGVFTKRLVALGKTIMWRNGGGNSTSINRRVLTDMFTSPEAIEDVRSWNVDQIDEFTRRQIFTSTEDGLNDIFNVNIHTLLELGVGQEYTNFYTNDLGAAVNAGDEEVVVGLDLKNRTSFVMPVREEVEIFPDASLHRQRRMGQYGWTQLGFSCLDNRNVLLFSF